MKNMNKKKVSIIITTYNSIKWIEKTIEKIKNQTMSDIEIIIVDDYSSDGTREKLFELCQSDNRINIILNKENIGAGASRNIGFKNSSCDYVMFLDDDDIYNYRMVEISYNNIIQYDADLLVYRSNGLDFHSKNEIETMWTINIKNIKEKQCFGIYDIEGNIFKSLIWWAWDKIFKREIIIRNLIEFQNIKSANDMFFVIKYTLNCKKIVYINDILITHTYNRSGSISNSRNKFYIGAMESLKAVYGIVKNDEIMLYNFKNYVISYLDWYIKTISGNGFLSLFYLSKEFIIEIKISENDIIDNDDKIFTRNILNLNHLDFLFYLKDRFMLEANTLRACLESR